MAEPIASLYVAAYDLEADPEMSLPAARALAAVHRRLQAPATFFIVTRLLEAAGAEYRAILDDDLFDLQSHTHTHFHLKDRPITEDLRREIELPKRLIRETFGREAIGLTTPGGHTDGLRGQGELLALLHENGFRFIRSDGRGPAETVPAPLTQPYWYAEEGFADLLEIPLQYWHDNVLKGYTAVATAWPPVVPWGLPEAPPETPEEEFAVWRLGAEYVVDQGLRIYMPTLHPWSIYRMDPEARTIELLLDHVRGVGMEIVSCREVYERARQRTETFPERKRETPRPERFGSRRHSLLSDANHDARTPLHPIVGFAEMLNEGALGPLNERQQAAADEILRCAERLAYVLEELVVAEKLEARRVGVELDVVSVEAVGRQVAVQAKHLSEAAEVEVCVEPGAEAVRADERRLLELLGALVRNAISFGTDRPRITLRARRAGERLVIEFSDNGPGIPPEIAHKVFLPLFKERAPGRAVPEGLGLGLTIAAGLARLMGGELRLDREAGPGATFRLELAAAEKPGAEDGQ